MVNRWMKFPDRGVSSDWTEGGSVSVRGSVVRSSSCPFLNTYRNWQSPGLRRGSNQEEGSNIAVGPRQRPVGPSLLVPSWDIGTLNRSQKGTSLAQGNSGLGFYRRMEISCSWYWSW